MKFGKNYLARVIAFQAVVLVVFLTVLFWGRGFCQMALWTAEWSSHGRFWRPGYMPLCIKPSGLGDGRTGAPRDEVEPSQASAWASPDGIAANLTGFFKELNQIEHSADAGNVIWKLDHKGLSTTGSRRANVNKWMTASYDAGSGRLVYSRMEKNEEDRRLTRQVIDYAGPGGVNADANADVGRFQSPVFSESGYQNVIVYDRGSRRFYEINFERREVRRGGELSKDHPDPVQIGNIEKNTQAFQCSWQPERLKKKPDNSETVPPAENPAPDPGILVLDDQCQIEYLDLKTLDLISPAGRLVFPQKSSSSRIFRLDDALAYRAMICNDGGFLGMIAGTLSGDGRSAAITVFDKNGKIVRSVQEFRNPADHPAGPMLLVGKFILESLHPPILTLASIGAAGRGDAAAGYQAMFVLPYSFAGLIGYYDQDQSIDSRIPQIVGICGPAMALGLFLAWRVKRDARLIGLAPGTRQAWYWATFALGLSAYITYRLTRPKDVLVTCENCGRLRRPDRDRCHQCGAVWNVPELTPPDWRVVQKIEGNPSIS